MKKVFPIAFLAFAGLAVAFTSCKKKSTTATCTCTYKSPYTNADTTIKYTGITAGSGYSSMSDFCNAENTAFKTIDSTGGCHL